MRSRNAHASSTTSTAPPHYRPCFFFGPPRIAAPEEFHLAVWKMLIEHLPKNDMHYGILLFAHAERQLKAITKPELASAVLPYSQATWAHGFPDNRADALYRSHYVLLVEFCLVSDPESGSMFVVQATVHPSMRNYRLHYPLLHVPINSSQGAFSMSKRACSCEDGYICTVSMGLLLCCRQDGICSHLQALLMSLTRVANGTLKFVRV